MAGVDFFFTTCFLVEEPRRKERQRLVVMPAWPTADFIIRQARFALAALQAILDAMLRLGHPRKLAEFRSQRSIAEVIIVRGTSRLIGAAAQHQSFFAGIAALPLNLDAKLRQLHDQRPFLAVT